VARNKLLTVEKQAFEEEKQALAMEKQALAMEKQAFEQMKKQMAMTTDDKDCPLKKKTFF
jgi:hypothetical protein